MKKAWRGIALSAAAFMLMASLAGCFGGKKSVSQAGVATLKYVFGGVGEMTDSQEVWEEFNQKLGEYLPNTKVEFVPIPYADYGEKWRLMASARETIDLAWFGWMLDFPSEVQKGSIMALDELIDQHAPDLKKELPGWLFDLTKMDGKTYLLPNYQMMIKLTAGVRTQDALAKEFNLDTEAITATFDKRERISKDDFWMFEDYLAKLKEAGKLGKGVSPSFLNTYPAAIGGPGQYWAKVAGNAVIDLRDAENGEVKVYDELTDFPDSIGYYELVNDWFKKGYIRQDILSIQDAAADEGKENGYVLWSHSYFKGDTEKYSKQYGFPVQVIPAFTKLFIPHSRPSTCTAIPATAQNPELSVKLMDLLNTEKGKDLFNLLVYGIEGKHYHKISDTAIEWLDPSAPGTSIDNHYGYDSFVFGNTFNAYESQFVTSGWNDYLKNEINANAAPSPLTGFVMDTSPIKLELVQYDTIMKEYDYLKTGANDNFRELLEERNKKLKDAGSDKIVEEARRQVEEFLKSKRG